MVGYHALVPREGGRIHDIYLFPVDTQARSWVTRDGPIVEMTPVEVEALYESNRDFADLREGELGEHLIPLTPLVYMGLPDAAGQAFDSEDGEIIIMSLPPDPEFMLDESSVLVEAPLEGAINITDVEGFSFTITENSFYIRDNGLGRIPFSALVAASDQEEETEELPPEKKKFFMKWLVEKEDVKADWLKKFVEKCKSAKDPVTIIWCIWAIMKIYKKIKSCNKALAKEFPDV